MKKYILLQWILIILLFIILILLAYRKNLLLFFFYRLLFFFFLFFFFLVIKIIYYFLCLPFFEEEIKNFFKKKKSINKISLFILKWTNLVYIYNDLLLIIIKVMSIYRYFYLNLDKKYQKYFFSLDKYIYILFFIIIKNFITKLILELKKIKKNFVEVEFNLFIRKRIFIWILFSYLFIIFTLKYNIFYLLIIYFFHIGFLSYSVIKRDIKYFLYEEKVKNDILFKSNLIFYNVKNFNIYDLFIQTDYIFIHCDFKEDYDITKINLIGTKKLIDLGVSKELKLYNEGFYWYQYDLYFFENNLLFILINNILYLLKLNILYIIRIEIELKENKNISLEKKNFLLEKKNMYINNLDVVKKFFDILKFELNWKFYIKIFDRVLESYDKENIIVKKTIDLKFKFIYDSYKKKIEKKTYNNLDKYYKKIFYNLRKINKEELLNYEYEKNHILNWYYIEIVPQDEFCKKWDDQEKGLISFKEFQEWCELYEKIDIYVYNFNYYIGDVLGLFLSNAHYYDDFYDHLTFWKDLSFIFKDQC